MPNPQPILPDAMPLREALRGLRHMLRRGGETLIETMGVEAQPRAEAGLAAGFAGVVLREVEAIAKGVDRAASGLAKTMLGQPEPAAPMLGKIAAGPGSEAVFAAACYSALRAVLHRLGTPGVFISEAAARRAYHRIAGQGPQGPATDFAAALTLLLLEGHVLRGASAEEAARVPQGPLEPVAVFAVMLWLLSERPEAEDEAALDAATDLALAVAPDVAAAVAAGDAARLQRLFAEFAAHV